MDVDELIRIVSDAVKKQEKSKTGSIVYHDEPIIRTARQLSNYVPDMIRKMRKITADDMSYRQELPCLFYRQGKFMENYEDDYEYNGIYNRYLSAYQYMDDKQLRGYFSWRTKVRRGNIVPTLHSFALIYVYELINMIGVATPQDGFKTLKNFWESYRDYDDKFDENMKVWLFDYVVYYNLDISLLDDLYDHDMDSAVMTLINYKNSETDELFNVIASLSPYRILKSRFYKEYSEEVKKVVCSVWLIWAEYCDKNRKRALYEEIFDRTTDYQYVLFPNAIFYDHLKYDEYNYRLSDIHNYSCRNHSWTCHKYTPDKAGLNKLGKVIKNIDCIMRDGYDFPHPLKSEKIPLYLSEIISSETEKFFEEKKAESVPQINIDISKLHDIRTESEITRDKLIVDEEESDESVTDENITEQNSDTEETVLDQNEYTFMHCMLYDENYDLFIRQKNIMLSVIVDSINEKLFDIFEDTVIVFDGETPEIIEDYEDELKGIVLK